jgi:hypothetical protein
LNEANKKNTFLKDVLEGGTLNQFGGHDIYVPADMRLYPPTAKPQVTGGVNLENILDLFAAAVSTQLPLESPTNPGEMQYLGEEPQVRSQPGKTPLGGHDYEKEAKILGEATKLASAYVESAKVRGIEGWDKLEGMLALIYSYLLAGARQEKVQDQAKYFMPLMSRMSFAGMYATLPGDAQKEFKPAGILALAGLNPSEPVYQLGFSDKAAGDSEVHRGPPRGDWLTSIVAGKDLMSAEGGTPVTKGMKASSPAMGQYPTLDPGHTKQPDQLVRIEMRRLPGEVPPEEWVPLATTLFAMFQRVQAPKVKV